VWVCVRVCMWVSEREAHTHMQEKDISNVREWRDIQSRERESVRVWMCVRERDELRARFQTKCPCSFPSTLGNETNLQFERETEREKIEKTSRVFFFSFVEVNKFFSNGICLLHSLLNYKISSNKKTFESWNIRWNVIVDSYYTVVTKKKSSVKVFRNVVILCVIVDIGIWRFFFFKIFSFLWNRFFRSDVILVASDSYKSRSD